MDSDSDLEQELGAFLRAHALPQAVPAVLMAEGEALYRRCAPHPPAIPQWGRFLVALGQLAAEAMDDANAAGRYFLRAVADYPRHGDAEAAITAGYDQGVLFERAGRQVHAIAAYQAAADLGLQHPPPTANALRPAMAQVRLNMATSGELDPGSRANLKRAWLAWLALRQERTPLDAELVAELERSLCAFLLPEDDPLSLAAVWQAWPPSSCPALPGSLHDGSAAMLAQLYAASAEAAEAHLADEGPDPGRPYRLLGETLERQRMLPSATQDA